MISRWIQSVKLRRFVQIRHVTVDARKFVPRHLQQKDTKPSIWSKFTMLWYLQNIYLLCSCLRIFPLFLISVCPQHWKVSRNLYVNIHWFSYVDHVLFWCRLKKMATEWVSSYGQNDFTFSSCAPTKLNRLPGVGIPGCPEPLSPGAKGYRSI